MTGFSGRPFAALALSQYYQGKPTQCGDGTFEWEGVRGWRRVALTALPRNLG